MKALILKKVNNLDIIFLFDWLCDNSEYKTLCLKISHVFLMHYNSQTLKYCNKTDEINKQCLECKFGTLGRGNQKSLIAYQEAGTELELQQKLCPSWLRNQAQRGMETCLV